MMCLQNLRYLLTINGPVLERTSASGGLTGFKVISDKDILAFIIKVNVYLTQFEIVCSIVRRLIISFTFLS